MRPFPGVPNHPSPDHVQVNINHAVLEMLAVLDGSAMIAILPKASASLFSPIEFLGYPARDEIHRAWNGTSPETIHDKKVDVV